MTPVSGYQRPSPNPCLPFLVAEGGDAERFWMAVAQPQQAACLVKVSPSELIYLRGFLQSTKCIHPWCLRQINSYLVASLRFGNSGRSGKVKIIQMLEERVKRQTTARSCWFQKWGWGWAQGEAVGCLFKGWSLRRPRSCLFLLPFSLLPCPAQTEGGNGSIFPRPLFHPYFECYPPRTSCPSLLGDNRSQCSVAASL